MTTTAQGGTGAHRQRLSSTRLLPFSLSLSCPPLPARSLSLSLPLPLPLSLCTGFAAHSLISGPWFGAFGPAPLWLHRWKSLGRNGCDLGQFTPPPVGLALSSNLFPIPLPSTSGGCAPCDISLSPLSTHSTRASVYDNCLSDIEPVDFP